MSITPSTAISPASNGAQLIQQAQEAGGSIAAFASKSNFEAAQRMANLLAASTMVPQAYQGNLSNCVIAIELAARIGASVFAVMQNMDIIHGRPGFRSTFLIATVNSCGRFTALRFRMVGKEGTDEWGCRAWATAKDDGEECVGTLITIGMAKAEGWYGKNGSKWKTMPEQMLMYRAAAFWARVYAPETSLGMHTADEIVDAYGPTGESVPLIAKAVSAKELEDALLNHTPAEVVPPNRATAEVAESKVSAADDSKAEPAAEPVMNQEPTSPAEPKGGASVAAPIDGELFKPAATTKKKTREPGEEG